MIGTGTIADRTLSKPAINVLAFEAPRVSEVSNQIVPTRARRDRAPPGAG